MLAKLKLILAAIGADLADTWRRCKVVVLVIGSAIVYLEFNKIKQNLLLSLAKKESQKDRVEDSALNTQETADNSQANTLVQTAESLPSTETPVTEDWYKSAD